MSGSGGDRWRSRPRGGYDPARSRPRPQHGMRDRSFGQGANRGHDGGGHNAYNAMKNTNAPGPAQEQHVPVRSFNAVESKTALKQASQATAYKPPAKDGQGGPPGGHAWGAKHCMANGANFFFELRKQVSALQNRTR